MKPKTTDIIIRVYAMNPSSVSVRIRQMANCFCWKYRIY